MTRFAPALLLLLLLAAVVASAAAAAQANKFCTDGESGDEKKAKEKKYLRATSRICGLISQIRRDLRPRACCDDRRCCSDADPRCSCYTVLVKKISAAQGGGFADDCLFPFKKTGHFSLIYLQEKSLLTSAEEDHESFLRKFLSENTNSSYRSASRAISFGYFSVRSSDNFIMNARWRLKVFSRDWFRQ